MVLSIGMIVKNEEKYLERCLTALKPILDSIDSELIIADTGSTDKTVEIARKFTDNVFYFEWINDFAAARNSTLERAKGEWYMFIDADEIATDCSDIINFFKSGEYKRYKSALITVRSYLDMAQSDFYNDILEYRLTAIENDVKFIKPVHENLFPGMTPCKILGFIVDHYGYMFSNNGIPTELAKSKSERNLEILFEDLKNQKLHGEIQPSIYNQISDCYRIVGNMEKALEYANKGFDSIEPSDRFRIMYYNSKMSLMVELKKFEEAIELCENYFSKWNTARNKQLSTDCFAYLIRAVSNYSLNNYGSAISDFISGFALYDKYINKKLITEELLLVPFGVTKPLIKSCCEMLYRCCYNTGRYDEAAVALKFFPVEDFLSDHEYMATHLLIRVLVMEHTDFNGLADLYRRLDDYNRQFFICIVRWHIFRTTKHEQMLKNMANIVKGDKHLEDLVSIFRHYFVKKDLSFESIKKYISDNGAIGNEDVWCIMMESHYDITPYIIADSFDPEKSTREVFFKYISIQDAANLFANYDINAVSPQGLERAAGVYGWAMIGALHNKLDVSVLFEKFGEIGLKWYNEFADEKNIPGDIRAALIVNRITSARKKGDYTLCVDEMRRLAAVCPPFAPLVNEYSKLVQQEAKNAAPKVMSEFDRLAAQVKQNIRDMIGAGNISEARATLKELGALCPNDPDIEILKDEINNMLQ